MLTRVVHCKVEPHDVYIGRGSKWGNLFKIGPDGDRAIPSLKGKLGCWCAPRRYHGDVLAELGDHL